MPNEVPEGWSSAALGDVIRLEYGRALSASARDPGQIPVYGSNGVCGQHSTALIKERGIVVGRKGTAGSVTVTTGPFWPIDTTYFVVPRVEADFDWLAAALEHARLSELNEATGVPGLNRDKAYVQPILLPPLDEQRRIADVLRSLDDAAVSQGAVVETATGVGQRLSSAYFIDPAEYEGPHPFGSFGDLFDIKGGSQPPKSTFAYEPSPGFVRLLQIRDFERDDKAAYIAEDASSVRCRENDILIARYGASVGRILTGKAGAYNVALTKVVFRSDRVHRRYAYHWLKSDYFQGRIAAVSGRSAQAGFNKEDLFPTQLVLPAYQEQEMVADTLDDLESQIDLARRAQNAVVALKESLRSDLLSGRVRVPA